MWSFNLRSNTNSIRHSLSLAKDDPSIAWARFKNALCFKIWQLKQKILLKCLTFKQFTLRSTPHRHQWTFLGATLLQYPTITPSGRKVTGAERKKEESRSDQFLLTLVWVLTHGSVQARPSPQPPIDISINFPEYMSEGGGDILQSFLWPTFSPNQAISSTFIFF